MFLQIAENSTLEILQLCTPQLGKNTEGNIKSNIRILHSFCSSVFWDRKGSFSL